MLFLRLANGDIEPFPESVSYYSIYGCEISASTVRGIEGSFVRARKCQKCANVIIPRTVPESGTKVVKRIEHGWSGIYYSTVNFQLQIC